MVHENKGEYRISPHTIKEKKTKQKEKEKKKEKEKEKEEINK